MRPELNKQNADKVYEIVNKLRDEHGIDWNPNRVVNFIVEHVDSLELTQIVKIGFTVVPPPGQDGKKKKAQRKKTGKTTNWVTEF